MITVGYECIRCGRKFDTKVFEKGEAESRRVQGSPVRCPECGSTGVKRR